LEKPKDLFNGPELVVGPVALNPIMAQMTAETCFKAVYPSSGSRGWGNGVAAGPAPCLRTLRELGGTPERHTVRLVTALDPAGRMDHIAAASRDLGTLWTPPFRSRGVAASSGSMY
jgi:hypothetical protein